MKLNWSEIIEGNRNRFFPPERLKEFIRITKEERLEICKTCPRNSTEGRINNFSTCLECGCPLKSKASCLSCKCPLEKWLAVMTKEEQQELNKNQ